MKIHFKIAFCLFVTLLPACGQESKTKTIEIEKKLWFEEIAVQSRGADDAVILPALFPQCSSHVEGFIPAAVNKILQGQVTRTTNDTLLLGIGSFKRQIDDRVVIQSSKDFFVCARGAAENSLESMTEKIVKDVEAAHTYYIHAAGPEALTLPKVNIEVQPIDEYRSYYRYADDFIAENQLSLDPISTEPFMVSGAQVNNAYYAPYYENPLIAFLPQSSANSRGAYAFPVALWNMPLVARHEYGHHVFFQHMRSVFGAANFDYRQLVLKNPDRHGTVPSSRGFAELGRSFPAFDNYFLMSALNEGFADLFAHETFEGSPYVIDSPCMGVTRNVTSTLLNGGTYKKAWTVPLLDHILDLRKPAPEFDSEDSINGCARFSLHSLHHVGALIAHSAYRVFSTADSVRSLAKKDEARFKLSLAWLKKINETMDPASDGPYRFLSTILLSAVEVARAGAVPNEELCAVIGEQFPGFKALWTKQAVDPSVLACLK